MRHIYKDMHAAFDDVKSRKANSWRRGETPSSEKTDGPGRVGWAKFYQMATKNPGDSFQSQIADVIQVASEIAEELPTKNSKTRKRAYGRKGGRVSVPAILSGNASRAFAHFKTDWTKRPPRHVAIIIPGAFAWHISERQIGWCTAGPLALALYLETEFGIAVDVWNYCAIDRPWADRNDNYESIIRVKPPTAGTSLEDVIPTMSASFLRAFHFRAIEVNGVPNHHYGSVRPLSRVTTDSLAFAHEYGIDGHVLVGVAGASGLLSDREAVMKWIETQFRVLELID